MISREAFLGHVANRQAIVYSEDESVIFAEKVFFAYRVVEWIFNKISVGEIDIDEIDRYWGMLSKYINYEIDFKIEDDVLYFNEVDESEYEEGC